MLGHRLFSPRLFNPRLFTPRCTSPSETAVLHRFFSSRNGSRNKSFNLKGLPFTVPSSSVASSFRAWTVEQGIDKLVQSTNVTPTYMPFYVFDFNMKDSKNRIMYHQGVPVYAGYNYRRSLANSAHEDTFANSKNIASAKIFDDRWLLKIHSGGPSFAPTREYIGEEVALDTWKSHRSSCWRVAMSEVGDENYDNKFELINSNRAYLPVYIVEYSLLGFPFRVAISGCDPNAQAPDIHHLTDHRLLSDETKVRRWEDEAKNSMPIAAIVASLF